MTDLSALADEIERLDGPSREMDARICAAFGISIDQPNTDGLLGDRWVRVSDDELRVEFGTFYEGENHCIASRKPLPVTASLDAALTLLDPRAMWAVVKMEEGPLARLCWPQPNGGFLGGYIESRAATPELALCAAALRARSENHHG
jgi:hypothetical protein